MGLVELLVRFSRPRWLVPLLVCWSASAALASDLLEVRYGYIDALGVLALAVHSLLAIVGWAALGLGLLWTSTEQGFGIGRARSGSFRREGAGVETLFALLVFPWRYALFAARELVPGMARHVWRSPSSEVADTNKAIARSVEAGARAVLGVDLVTGDPVGLSHAELVRHTLILGATGSGKTTSLRRLLTDTMSMGYATVLIDLKGDPQLAAELAEHAAHYGRPFSMFSDTPGQRRDLWNPLELGDPVTRRDKLIALSDWSEPYYRTVCERFAQTVFATYEALERVPTIDDLVELLDSPAKLARLNTRNPSAAARARVATYLEAVESDKSQRSALSGFAARIGTLVDPAGPLHYDPDEPAWELQLEQVIAAGGVVCFSLNSARGRATSAQLATLAILDLLSVVGERIAGGASAQTMIAVDEFSAIEADDLLGLLARARSADVGVVLSTQELADLAKVDETFCDQVLGNTATKIIHRQDVPDSAELAARLVGTQQVIKPTYKVDESGIEGMLGRVHTGEGSYRPVEEFIVHPNDIKRLATGNALVIRKEPQLAWHVTGIYQPGTLPEQTPTADEPSPANETTDEQPDGRADLVELVDELGGDPRYEDDTLTIRNVAIPVEELERVADDRSDGSSILKMLDELDHDEDEQR